MSDIFKAIADPKARLVLETLANTPGSTAAKTAELSKLKSDQAATALAILVEAKLVKSTGSGASKKYSLNAKGFAPYVKWLAKVAETQAVSALELQLVDLGDKLGKVIADGSDWVSSRVKKNVDVDPKAWGKELGRILADIKSEVQSESKQAKKQVETRVEAVKNKVKSEAKKVQKQAKTSADQVKNKVQKEAKKVQKAAKATVAKVKKETKS